jgi:hypothetical protein
LLRWSEGGVDRSVPGSYKVFVGIDVDESNTFFHMVKNQIIEEELQCFEGVYK